MHSFLSSEHNWNVTASLQREASSTCMLPTSDLPISCLYLHVTHMITSSMTVKSLANCIWKIIVTWMGPYRSHHGLGKNIPFWIPASPFVAWPASSYERNNQLEGLIPNRIPHGGFPCWVCNPLSVLCSAYCTGIILLPSTCAMLLEKKVLKTWNQQSQSQFMQFLKANLQS